MVKQPGIEASPDRLTAELRLQFQAIRASLVKLQWLLGTIVAGPLALVTKSFF